MYILWVQFGKEKHVIDYHVSFRKINYFKDLFHVQTVPKSL